MGICFSNNHFINNMDELNNFIESTIDKIPSSFYEKYNTSEYVVKYVLRTMNYKSKSGIDTLKIKPHQLIEFIDDKYYKIKIFWM